MKKSIRYSLIIARFVYLCFAFASIFVAYKTYQSPLIYGVGFDMFFNKIWNGSLFLFNILLYLTSMLKAYRHLLGKARLWWAFLWAFLLHGLIGMWFIIPVGCYAHLRKYMRTWDRKSTIYELWSIWYFSLNNF